MFLQYFFINVFFIISLLGMRLNDLSMDLTKLKKIPHLYSAQNITFILPIESIRYQKKIINNKEELGEIHGKKIYLLDFENSSKIMNFLLAKTKGIYYSEQFCLNTKKFINLLVGPMCSGKTSELIDYCERDMKEGEILVFKHTFDNFRKSEFLYTRDEKKKLIKSQSVSFLYEIINFVEQKKSDKIIIIIDELQFFSDINENFQKFNNLIEKMKINVYMAALDQDYTGNLFPNMSFLGDNYGKIDIKKKTAKCHKCKEDAYHSQRDDNDIPASHNQEKIKPVGPHNEEIKVAYYPVCSQHHLMPPDEEYDDKIVNSFFPFIVYID